MLTHIIIVNYNAGAWLSRSVASALRYSRGDVSVVDNDSSDDSVVTAKATHNNPRLAWVMNEDNLGFAAANNQVLRTLSADYAVLMNPDCELQHSTIEAIIEVMQSNPDIGLASCKILNEDGTLQATSRRKFPTPWSAFVRMSMLNKVFPGNPKFADFDYGDVVVGDEKVSTVEAISGAFMVARKKAIDEVGLLDESYFMHCEDLDWCKRFELAGWKVAFVPTVSVMHAKGVSSKSRPVRVLYTLHLGMVRFFDKFYRNTYSWPLRATVKFGIAMSFIARAVLSLLRR